MGSLKLTDRERLMLRTLILERQAGNAAGSVSFYMRTDFDDNKKKEAWIEQLKTDLGDLHLQTEMLARDLGIDIKQMDKLALERYLECKEEFELKGKSQYFI